MECLSKSEAGCATLVEYAAGRLLGRNAREVASHTNRCTACSAFALEQSKLFDLMDLWEPAPVSMAFNRKLYARIQESSGSSWVSVLERVLNGLVARPAFPIAALSILVIAGLYIDRPQVGAVSTRSVSAPIKTSPAVSPNDAEQLDKALDDLQLLHQLDLVKDEAGNASRGM